jgi:hypothetical protein
MTDKLIDYLGYALLHGEHIIADEKGIVRITDKGILGWTKAKDAKEFMLWNQTHQ